MRDIPIITFINKMDRESRDPFEVLDEVEEKLALENAQLRAAIAERDKADAQKQAQAVFEGACKRAGIDLAACQYDAKAQAVVKAEAKK